MSTILPRVRFSVKEKLLQHLRRCRHAGLRCRYLIVINLLNGRGAYATAEVLGIHNTTVYRVAQRFREHGEWGLLDGREDNGTAKLDERYLAILYRTVRSPPQKHGWRRRTWTRELLVETLARQTGVRIHVATMSRALALIQARRAGPAPRSAARGRRPPKPVGWVPSATCWPRCRGGTWPSRPFQKRHEASIIQIRIAPIGEPRAHSRWAASVNRASRKQRNALALLQARPLRPCAFASGRIGCGSDCPIGRK